MWISSRNCKPCGFCPPGMILTGCMLVILGMAACKPAGPAEVHGMASVPAGWFVMGENDGRKSNQPQHSVYLDAYQIQITEVTRRDFSQFISVTGYYAPGWEPNDLEASAELPVTGVLWKDADVYCQWAGMRLPTEAEWEKAARGEDGIRYPWGNEWDPHKANTHESGADRVLPVGSFPQGASPYGVLDMCGNAAEWVADYFDFTDYSAAPDHNPTGTEYAWDHGLRGGSYASPADQATTYFRDSSHSARPNPRVGFRCASSK